MAERQESRAIAADRFLDALEERGLIPPETRRVIIDASYDAALTIYVEHIAGKPLLDGEVLDVLMDADMKVVGG